MKKSFKSFLGESKPNKYTEEEIYQFVIKKMPFKYKEHLRGSVYYRGIDRTVDSRVYTMKTLHDQDSSLSLEELLVFAKKKSRYGE